MERSKNVIFPGRFQPLHRGHIEIIRQLLDGGAMVTIALRDTPISEHDPFTIDERIVQIRNVFERELHSDTINIITIPDFSEIVHGRDPGWSVKQIVLESDLEEISATRIRGARPIWFTGNVNTGKTTLAKMLVEQLEGVLLDGDEMRADLLPLGFSLDDRKLQNVRVANLARNFQMQGKQAVVSVIAPTRSIRIRVSYICNPIWVWVERPEYDMLDREEYPYENPRSPHVHIVNDGTISEACNRLVLDLEALKRG